MFFRNRNSNFSSTAELKGVITVVIFIIITCRWDNAVRKQTFVHTPVKRGVTWNNLRAILNVIIKRLFFTTNIIKRLINKYVEYQTKFLYIRRAVV
jgi:hypothetical protein